MDEVIFDNIVVRDGIFEADATITVKGYTEHVVAKLDGSYCSSNAGNIIRAVWSVIVRYKVSKKKFPKSTSVMWG